MSNVMSLKSFSNKVKRNGFDLSFKNAFTAKAGELLPVFCKEVIPGDKWNIKGQAFTRTQPLASAAFVRMREYYDFFFVPYKLLWNRYPTFFTNLPDFHQAKDVNSSVDIGDQHPYFTVGDIEEYLKDVSGSADEKVNTNFFGYSRSDLSRKLLNYLGYGGFSATGSYQSYVLNPNPLLAYQKVCQDFFRDDQWEKASPYRYNLDYIVGTSDLHIPVSTIDISQLTMFDLNYCNFSKDYFMGMLPSSQYGEEAFVPISLGEMSVDSSVSSYYSPVGVVGSNVSQVPVDAPILASSLGSGTMERVLNAKKSDGSYPVNTYAASDLKPSYLASLMKVSEGSSSSGFSVLALRQAEALQKWREIAQSGRQDYQTQMQKHFGVSPSDAMSNHCKYIGGWTNNIDINEVVNTNLTDPDSSQADIYGKGTGVAKGNVDYDVKEHGIIIGIYHCLPLLDYSHDGRNKLCLKSHFTDYAIPEFDSVGMQQLDGIELVASVAPGMQLGWVPRYAEYKTSVDEVHGAFTDSLEYWVSPMTTEYFQTYFDTVEERYGSFNITYEFFKVNPSILDNLFAAHVDSTVNTDQFLVNSFFDTKVVRNLDYNGLPY